MPIVVLGLSLLFGTFQSLWLTDCPCNLLCQDKNTCDPEEAPEDDCCTEKGKKDVPCFHLEPQTDVDGPEQTPDLVPPLVELAVLVSLETPVASVEDGTRPRPTRDRPLYLEHSALLI